MTEEFYDCEFGALPIEIPGNMNTFPKLLYELARMYPSRRVLGTREFCENAKRGSYEWYSYTDFFKQALMISKCLEKNGFTKGSHIGIISPNRSEWTIIEFACAISSICLVPLYDT